MTATLFVAFVLLQTPQPASPPPPATAVIVGRVVDAATGTPVALATVDIWGPALARGVAPKLMTDGRGRFLYRNLPAGEYTVQVTKAGYVEGMPGRRRPDGPHRPVEVAAGERLTDLTIPIWKYGSITGTIVDESGEPVVGVQVRGLRKVTAGGRSVWRPHGVTFGSDDRGVFRVGNLPPGEYIVMIVPQNHSTPTSVNTASRSAAPGDRAQREIQSAFSILGFVTMYLTGSTATSTAGHMVSLPRGLATPTGDGLPRTIYPPTYHPGVTSIAQAGVVRVASGQERTSVDIAIRAVPAVRVSGTLIAPEGSLGHTPVRLDTSDNVETMVDSTAPFTITDANGGFTFATVPAGSYWLRAVKVPPPVPVTEGGTRTTIQSGSTTIVSTAGDDRSAPPPVSTDPTWWTKTALDVGRRDIDGLQIPLQQGIRFSGRLEFDGAAVRPDATQLRRVSISIQSSDQFSINAGSRAASVDDQGRFQTIGFPGGKYFVRVPTTLPGWTLASVTHEGRDLSEVPIDASGDISGVVVTFTDRPAEISGAVRNASGPDADASVVLFPAEPALWATASNRRLRLARVTKTGTYSFKAVPAGSYYVVAIPDDQSADWQQASLLEELSRQATQVTIDEGMRKTQELRTVQVRRTP